MAHASLRTKGRVERGGYATLDGVIRRLPRRPTTPRIVLLAALLAAGAPAAFGAPVQAAGTLTIDGRGFGHGVGMSQYGAYGLALHGRGYRDILAHYYSGTQLGSVSVGQEVRVLLAGSRDSLTVTQADRVGRVKLDPRRAYRLRATRTGGVVVRDEAGKKVTRESGAVRISAGGGAGAVKLLGPAGDGVSDGEYRGALVVAPEAGDRVSVVNAVGIEDYVRGVVGAESPSGWPAAALRAQAVAARGYALSTNAGGAGGAFTQYPDTRSQVYHGVAAETAATDAAVAATRGQVVTYRGAPIVSYFFSTSGGRTENVENGFPGSEPRPYLVSVADPYDDVSPLHTWRVRMTLAEADAKLAGLVPGTLRRVVVLRRGASRRILRARLVGSAGSAEVDGATLRSRLGLRDSWARFSVVTSSATRRTVRRPVGGAAAVGAGAVAGADSAGDAGSATVPAATDLAGLFANRSFLGAVALRAARSAGHVAREAAPSVAGQSPQPSTGSGLPAAAAPAGGPTRRVRVRTLSGRVSVSGTRARALLRVQRRDAAGHWHTVASVRTARRGIYTARVPGPGSYRVRSGALVGPVVAVG